MEDITDTTSSDTMKGLIKDWRAMIILDRTELGRPKWTLLLPSYSSQIQVLSSSRLQLRYRESNCDFELCVSGLEKPVVEKNDGKRKSYLRN